jgi:hypothetical protein
MNTAEIIEDAAQLPAIHVSEANRLAAASLAELLQREQQEAAARINQRRLALNRWAAELMKELSIPAGYVFDFSTMTFVDTTTMKGKPL